MKDKKISDLTALDTITGNEIIPVSANGMNYGLPVSKLAKADELAELSKSLEGKANKDDIPDVSGFATKEELGDIDSILDNINGEVIV